MRTLCTVLLLLAVSCCTNDSQTQAEKVVQPKRINKVAWRMFYQPGPVGNLVVTVFTDTFQKCEYVVFQSTEGIYVMKNDLLRDTVE